MEPLGLDLGRLCLRLFGAVTVLTRQVSLDQGKPVLIENMGEGRYTMYRYA